MQQTIVLIGNTGSGKRTLFKKIIDAETTTEENDDNVSVGYAIGRKFMIFNTPGLGGQSNLVYRVAGILAALQKVQGRRVKIILVVKCKRVDALITEIQNLLKPFTKYLNSIMIAITNWYTKYDQSFIKQKVKEETNLDSLFFKKMEEGNIICQKFNQVVSDSRFPILNVQLTQNEIEDNFEFFGLDSEYQFSIFDLVAQQMRRFKIKVEDVQRQIQNIRRYDDVFNKMEAFINQTKACGNQIAQSFEEILFIDPGLDHYYIVYCYLRQKLQQHANLLDKQIQQILNSKRDEIVSINRLCPTCGQICVVQNGFNSTVICQNERKQRNPQAFLDSIPLLSSLKRFIFGESKLCGFRFLWRDAQMASSNQIGIPPNPNLNQFLSFNSFRLEKSRKKFKDNLNNCIQGQINIIENQTTDS